MFSPVPSTHLRYHMSSLVLHWASRGQRVSPQGVSDEWLSGSHINTSQSNAVPCGEYTGGCTDSREASRGGGFTRVSGWFLKGRRGSRMSEGREVPGGVWGVRKSVQSSTQSGEGGIGSWDFFFFFWVVAKWFLSYILKHKNDNFHYKLQTGILEWVAVSPPGDLPDPGIELASAALQADSLPAEQSGKSDESEGFVYPQKWDGNIGGGSVRRWALGFPWIPSRE